jgi:hypothetical protein
MAGQLLDALIGFVVASSLTVLRPTLRCGRHLRRNEESPARGSAVSGPAPRNGASRPTQVGAAGCEGYPVNLGPALGSGLYGLLLDEVTPGSSLVLCAVTAALVAAAGFLRLVKT